ncbi:MAG: DUF721 domain-containing protein [Nitrospiraceae bacterium]|nr:MAG: DUF721 domain-containing protein [Nitrospiraceae bacterium]
MRSLHNILKAFIKDYGLEGGVALNAFRNQWAGIVGQTIAAHTAPDTMKSKVLTVIVDSPQWLHHLSFFREEIITKLRPFNVTDIRFRVGSLPEQSDGDQHRENNCELTDDDLRYIENTLGNVRDEELRESFRTLIVHGLTRGKR